MIRLTQIFCDRCHSTKEIDTYYFPKKLFSSSCAITITENHLYYSGRERTNIDLCNHCLDELSDLFKGFFNWSDNE